ncbi:hypothetical protein K505DRAFT_243221, partial [Melanomma pulvis-pyrius CBS 109.77]
LACRLATAYALGLLSSTGPRLISILCLLGKRKLTLNAACLQLYAILRRAVGVHRFPAFCGILIGGSTLLQTPIKAFIVQVVCLIQIAPTSANLRIAGLLARFIAALVSASVSFGLLNSGPPKSPSDKTGSREVDEATLGASSLSRIDLAGRTMNLTLFSVIRALDIVMSSAWNRLSPENHPRFKTVSRNTPTMLFCLSAATIMHAWFYSPSRLPQSYNTWISAAAELDHRLLLALRHARYGTWVYGKDTGMAPLLGSMCRDYGLEERLGDPAQTVPIPCELVHMGSGKSCEKHALVRFWRGCIFAAKMYAPLQLLVLVRHVRKKARPGNNLAGLTQPILLRTFSDMARSSAFLGAFISFFYYGVCLSRTRIGPKLFSAKSVTPQMWESGLCVLGGCLLCGTSILFEQPRKRLEILFFVLPRAAATWFPRRYLPENRWKEQLAFTISTAVVLTTAQEDSGRVRGVLGNALHGILKTN